MDNISAVLTILSVLSDIYSNRKEKQAQEKHQDEVDAYEDEMKSIQRRQEREDWKQARRGALGRAIGSDVSLNYIRPPSDGPDAPGEYRTPEWIDTARGVSSALGTLGSYAGDDIESGLNRYYTDYANRYRG